MDGPEPVLGFRRPGSHGHHGQVLHDLQLRLHITPDSGEDVRGAHEKELLLDNLGICRFHRGGPKSSSPRSWGTCTTAGERFLRAIDVLASRLHSRNSPIFWESERNIDFLHTFLKRKKEIDRDGHPELSAWLDKFCRDRVEAAREFWYETLKGIDESLREFF